MLITFLSVLVVHICLRAKYICPDLAETALYSTLKVIAQKKWEFFGFLVFLEFFVFFLLIGFWPSKKD